MKDRAGIRRRERKTEKQKDRARVRWRERKTKRLRDTAKNMIERQRESVATFYKNNWFILKVLIV